MLCAQELPVFAFLDLNADGVSQRQKLLLIDLISYNIFETERVVVIDRRERDKLLKGLGVSLFDTMDDRDSLEIGELLQADYIIRGSLIQQEDGYSMSLKLINVVDGKIEKTIDSSCVSWQELVDDCRAIAAQLLEGFSAASHLRPVTSKLILSLVPVRIKERILFVSPLRCTDNLQTSIKQIIHLVAADLLAHKNASVFITSLPYDLANPDLTALQKIVRDRNCHSFAIITQEDNKEYFCLYTKDLELQSRYVININQNMKKSAAMLSGAMARSFELLPQTIISEELEKAIIIDEKIEPLIFNQKILSHQLSLVCYQKFIKSALLVEYHPLFNLVGLEADLIWNYSKLLGVGIGCGYAYSYPALIDIKLADHPLVSHFEIRAIPLHFRTAGFFSLHMNLTTSLHMHNVYKITYYPDDSHTYTDEAAVIFFRMGLNVGLALNVSEELSIYIDAVTLSYIILLTSPPNEMTRQPFSGDIGGIGIMYRF
jgi:hypothetical protein